ncbi:MAG: TonB-dependent receptor [Alcanivoracaceae bacterium]|nr:TonB-dependent receptor [Alcanivoracaceae bacterium]
MKIKLNLTITTQRKLLYSAILASLSLANIAIGQPEDTDKNSTSLIAITGSTLQGIGLKNSQPIIIIERAELLASGLTDVGDLLQRLPYFSGSPLSTRTNAGGTGEVRIDLRGIGTGHTLVLIDGRRTVDKGDFQSIPSAMIERIEILKEGASAIYGADAVAGVVNIITRSDFTGAEVEFSISDSFDTDNVEIKQGSLVFGQSIDDAGFVFGIQYEDQSAAAQGDTPYDFLQDSYIILDAQAFAEGGFVVGADYLNTVGSTRIPCGHFNLASGGPSLTINGADPSTGNCGTPGALLSPPDFREFNGDFFDPDNDTYNYAPVNYIQTPFKKTNIFFNGHKEINNVEIFTSFRYNHRTSSQQLAPLPYDSNFDPAAPLNNGGNGIPADNVFNPFGENITRVRRRMSEVDRSFTQDIQQYQALLGVRGNIMNTSWNWEASYNSGLRERVDRDFGQFIGSRLALALGSSFFDTNGIATCGTTNAPIAGCVPLNLLGGTGTVTQEMLDYISATLTNVTQNQLDVFNANISGILFDLPAGEVTSTLALEYRYEESDFTLDSPRVVDNATGGEARPLSGSYDVTSLSTEFNIPLMDSEAMGELTFNLGARYDDYSTSGSNTSLQGNLVYRPTDSLLIRATYAEVFHEPSISLLFTEQFNAFPQASDPCENSNFNNLTAEQQAICIAQGVPPIGLPQIDTQLRQILGGNPGLKPESGATKTAGIVWSPEFLEGFTSTLDWWQIDLNGGFANIGFTQTILNCLNSLSVASPECARVSRRIDGSIIAVSGTTINASNTLSEGMDFALNYTFGTDYGQFAIGMQYSKIFDNHRQQFTGDDIVELEGRFTENSAYNEERAQLTVVWDYHDWSINYGLNYLSDIAADLQFLNTSELTQRIPSQSYSDIALTYTLPWQQTNITVGINNMFDRAPPFIESGVSGSTQPATYRTFGRSWFVRWKTRF